MSEALQSLVEIFIEFRYIPLRATTALTETQVVKASVDPYQPVALLTLTYPAKAWD